MARLEDGRGIRSLIHMYGGNGGWRRSPLEMLFDPAYRVTEAPFPSRLRRLVEGGWAIGLHPSFSTWKNTQAIRNEKEKVEAALGMPITAARQHWLRFSWQRTWKAQEDAGILFDSTLAFNDRSGFRNGAAVRFHPWDFDANGPMKLQATPTILMDSHLYDYADFTAEERTASTKRWIDEIHDVHGTASILWHPHTLSPAYGWRPGFETLLDLVKG